MITIIGNGESRKDIELCKVKGTKIGCNAIYLHEKVDLVCAMDKFWRDKIEKESKVPLLSRKCNMSAQSTLQIFYKGTWMNTITPYRGYCSGTSALDYVCSTINPGHPIFLIGFDFDYKGKYVNHVYKGTENHPKENRPAQNENIFLNETLQIVNRYPKHNIIWVSDNKDFVIKINRITIQQYKNIVYNC